MTRTEHLVWCKQRALEYLDRGDITNAIGSMTSDIDIAISHRYHRDHEQRRWNTALRVLAHAARRWIEGFN